MIHLPTGTISVGDYWEESIRNEHINVKEVWAVLKGLQSLPESVSDCRIDAQVDSMVVFRAWSGRGPRSRRLTQISKWIFQLLADRNLSLEMSFAPSHLNQADWFSRRLSRSDAMLSPKSWEIVQRWFGGVHGHDLDLMSLDSNVQRDWRGNPLKHFTPYPTPGSSGVNVFNQDLSVCDGNRVNAYVFSPFSLIELLLRFLTSVNAVVTVVVPLMSPLPERWPLLNALSSHSVWWPRGYHRLRSFFLQRMALYLAPLLIAFWHLGLGKTCLQSNRRNLLSFQSLPLVPRLFEPSVSCPACSKPNDFDFRYCQRCGYQRQSRLHQTLKSLKALIGLCSIRERKKTSVAQQLAIPYQKQRGTLEIDFSQFLESTSKRDICSAIPDGVDDFLIWKDNFGKMVVHFDTCPMLGEKSASSCVCPKRLAYGSVDSIIGKLRAIFSKYGSSVGDSLLPGIANPAASPQVKFYLSALREEQLAARVVRRQAEPFFLQDWCFYLRK